MMKLYNKDSVEDLILRGFPRDYVLQKTGVDIGYCGHNYKKALTGIDRTLYKIEFIKNNFTQKQILDQIEDFSGGKTVSEIYEFFGIYPKLQKTFRKICTLLGYKNEFEIVAEKNQKTLFKNGIRRIYGVENSSQLDFVQKKKKENSLKKYGCEYPTQSKDFIEKVKSVNMKKYGVVSTTQIPEIRQKQLETLKKNYGVESPLHSKEVKEKVKNTLLEKYGVSNPMKSPEVKKHLEKSLLEKYGVTNSMKYKPFAEACFRARKEHGTLNTSKIEEYLFEKLILKFTNVERNYEKDSRYPFACDFYIPERDLFIELNAHWTHQPMFGWYNGKSKKHREFRKEIEKRFPKWCPMAWWVSDVQKRKTAKENNLNYVVLWNEEDIEKWFELNCPDGQDGRGMRTWKKNK